MPSPNDPASHSHLPQADDEVLAKRDLWAAAKEAAMAKRQAATRPEPVQPTPAPVQRRRIKIRKPAVNPALAAASEVIEPVADELPAREPDSLSEAQELDEMMEVEARHAELHVPEDKRSVAIINKAEKPASVEPKAEPREPAPASKASEKPATVEANIIEKPVTTEPKVVEKPQSDVPKPEVGDSETTPEDEAAKRHRRLRKLWDDLGGRYLTISVGIHLFLLLAAAFVYLSYAQNERIDFLPGGGTKEGDAASKSLENQVTRKKTRWLQKVPMQRIAVDKAISSITLPDARPDLLDLPMNKDFMDAGKLGSFGFGKTGAGGGFGSGIGVGGKSGVTFTPLSMFGKKIFGKRIIVVLDVSRSMTSYLEDVVKELDRVAPGSPVMLYCGCGVRKPEEVVMERTGRTQHPHFEVYWRIWQGDIIMTSSEKVDPDRVKFDKKQPVAQPDVFNFFKRRNQTFFVYDHTLDYTWIALLSEQARNADTIYWFSDFEDPVDSYQLKTVLDNLVVRRQRLYIHPQLHGSSFKKIVNELVIPSGGDVVEPEEDKKKK
jgi:hypothetical protein